jgi:hypothetical protein
LSWTALKLKTMRYKQYIYNSEMKLKKYFSKEDNFNQEKLSCKNTRTEALTAVNISRVYTEDCSSRFLRNNGIY